MIVTIIICVICIGALVSVQGIGRYMDEDGYFDNEYYDEHEVYVFFIFFMRCILWPIYWPIVLAFRKKKS